MIAYAKNNGYTSMEISSWLVTQRSVTLSVAEIPEDAHLSKLSFEESEGYFEALDTRDEVWTGKPIDALKENNLIVWQRNVDDWLNSDSITVPFLKAESSDEESLQSTLEEDRELEIIVSQRENQEEIEVDIDDL